ncbi:2-dehydropantoate 2-reductase [Metarhizium album ARSEF 1941]|uniref:2-dehydropantoate 2-reductase n=1 Tax=Metarhizium album (strain ARSEF 1941) TaxID=1081103 RepID=A0A0B2WZ11_METAS|nr:2-dehydropantoate 2-reductase [Metarhizium album ARSEF 1941]KHN98677.1 2-dehydropantoate 2-reductase [Metarhizium album ARSEF 1941]
MRVSPCVGRVARRRYGTVASSTGRHQSREPAPPSSPADPIQRPWSTSYQLDSPIAKPRPQPQFYVPSVLLPREAANSPTVHKIHILGDDERSKFIAHALSSVYDSVEMLGWRRSSSKYRNIQKARPSNRWSAPNVEPNLAAMPRAIAQDDDSKIDQLVVSGRGYEAVEALQAVKNRIDENTTVCLMNDGLGVLEDVRKRIFEGTTDAAPSFWLGHMSHRLAFNRTYDAVTQLKHGQTKLTFAEAPRMRVNDMHKVESRPNFVKTLQEAKDLRTTMTPFDQWLRFKLPAVIFDSVVEPVCVLLEMPYQGLLQNPAAQRMMHSLLSEIIQVLENMPELEGSTAIRDYVQSKGVRKFMYGRIMGKQSQPSQLVRRIEHGLPTDVEYLNGYFLRRGQKLGLDLRMNVMMRDMIKAKHSQAIERLNSYIPMEETSIPSHSAFRYRTTPR